MKLLLENIRKIKTEKWIRNYSEGKEYILSHQDTTFVEHYQERRHCQDHSQSFVNLTWASHLSIVFCFSLTNCLPFKETCQEVNTRGRQDQIQNLFISSSSILLFLISFFSFFAPISLCHSVSTTNKMLQEKQIAEVQIAINPICFTVCFVLQAFVPTDLCSEHSWNTWR